MARLVTTDFDLSIAEDFLKRQQLRHVCAKRRADTLTLLTGPADDPWPRARFRIVTKQRWTVEMADRAGRWEKTPFQGSLKQLLALLVEPFPWILADL